MMKNLVRKLIDFLEALIAYLKETYLKTTEEKENNPPAREFRNKRVLEKAAKEIGVVEWKNGSNPKVEKYHAHATKENKQGAKDDVPWCASFIAYVLETVGMGSTNSKAARSYLMWGVSTKKNPWPGDIVVFWRGSLNGWRGHAGFLVKAEGNYLWVLGGNQNNEVNITKYSRSKLLDIRRSSLHRSISVIEHQRLISIANDLIEHGKVLPPGSLD